jgi:hypothetical protein
MRSLIILILLSACSYTKADRTTTGDKKFEVTQEEGVWDKASKDKECGILDTFIDKCQGKDKSLSQ